MSYDIPASRPSEQDPISDAIYALARDLHDDIVGGLTTGSQEKLDEHRRDYPQLLFGMLAMNLAGVELPSDAAGPDRARAIAAALQRIATTPELFESVTGAPYSADLAGSPPPKTAQYTKKELAAVAALKQKIAKTGYINASTFSDDRLLRLQYATHFPVKTRFLRRSPQRSTLMLKLTPAVLS